MATVVLCNAVGLAANAAAAVYTHKAADAYSAASMLYASNNTRSDAIKYVLSARSDVQLAINISSVQHARMPASVSSIPRASSDQLPLPPPALSTLAAPFSQMSCAFSSFILSVEDGAACVHTI